MGRALKQTLDVEAVREGDTLRLDVKGGLGGADVRDVEAVLGEARPQGARAAEIALADQPLDARAVAVLDLLCRRLEQRGLRVRVLPANDEQARVLASQPVVASSPEPERSRRKPPVLDRLALRQRSALESFLYYLHLSRSSLAQVVSGLFGRTRRRTDDFLQSTVRMGRDALPLVVLISALIGAILALQAGPFFRRYGQEILVAQLVAMSMLREIGPLLTAILVAGRSGSSLAAEIGTMKVSEEIDALTVMGAHPVQVLVVPRLLALLCALPCLVIVSDLVGVGGGLFACAAAMDVSFEAYIEETRKAVRLRDVLGGLAKAAAYAIVIVTVAAHQGFSTSGGAAGVGRRTTKSVVLSILWIIVVDTFFTWVLYKIEP